MVATEVVVLNQVPPPGKPVNVVLAPTHAPGAPDITGVPLMVTIVVGAVPQPVE